MSFFKTIRILIYITLIWFLIYHNFNWGLNYFLIPEHFFFTGKNFNYNYMMNDEAKIEMLLKMNSINKNDYIGNVLKIMGEPDFVKKSRKIKSEIDFELYYFIYILNNDNFLNIKTFAKNKFISFGFKNSELIFKNCNLDGFETISKENYSIYLDNEMINQIIEKLNSIKKIPTVDEVKKMFGNPDYQKEYLSSSCLGYYIKKVNSSEFSDFEKQKYFEEFIEFIFDFNNKLINIDTNNVNIICKTKFNMIKIFKGV